MLDNRLSAGQDWPQTLQGWAADQRNEEQGQALSLSHKPGLSLTVNHPLGMEMNKAAESWDMHGGQS